MRFLLFISFFFPSIIFAQILDASYEGKTLYEKYLILKRMNLDFTLSFENVPLSRTATLKEKVAALAIETENLKNGYSYANWKADQFGELYTSINNRIFKMKTTLRPTENPENLWVNPKPLSQVNKEFSDELGFSIEELMLFEIRLGNVLHRLIETNKNLEKSLEIAKESIKKDISFKNIFELLEDLSANITDCSVDVLKNSENKLNFELREVPEDVTTAVQLESNDNIFFKLEKQNLQSKFYGYKIVASDSKKGPIKYIRFGYNKNNKLTSAHFELNNQQTPYIYCNENLSDTEQEYWSSLP